MRLGSLLMIAAGAAMLFAATADARTGGGASGGASGASAGAASGGSTGGGGGGIHVESVVGGPPVVIPRDPRRARVAHLLQQSHCGSEMAARDFYDYGYDSYARFCLTEDPAVQ